MTLAVALLLLVIGTILFHFLSPWWFTPIASNWTTMDDTVNITFVVTGIVFVAVNLFMAFAVLRYRHRKGLKAQYSPENKKLEWWLTIVTSLGVAAMLTPGLFVWAKFVTVPKDAAVVEAVAQQWTWSYRFPGRDGVLGTTDPKLITPDNPFGLDPKDPKGADDVLIASQELHLPVNKPVKVLLRSKDVNHQFAVAQFRVKMDMVPGMVTYLWLTPTRIGRYDLLCEQLCGLAHFAMRGRVVVDDESTFQTWLAGKPTYSQTAALLAGDPAAGKATYGVCSACHGPAGQGNQALNAPRLNSQAGWYLAKQLRHFKQGVRGADARDTYAKTMIPMAATLADDTAINNVVAYINSLPDEPPAPATLAGDPGRGKSLYTTCAACHGNSGEGVWSTNAPRLAHMGDWYLARQLHNFQQGIRGTHPQDFSGAQMVLMSKILTDERAVNDLLSYIRTLDGRPAAHGLPPSRTALASSESLRRGIQ
jgi:cytochrome c oxidase subunit 2